MELSATEKILEKLIGFSTVSRDSNLAMIHYIEGYLSDLGIASTLTFNDEKTKANLYAQLGPDGVPGIMLSGHTDVVPVDGQDWSVDPFSMSMRDDKLYGRGATDMKGFIASVLAMLPEANNHALRRPIELAFSYDEEIGCVGIKRMIELLQSATTPPEFCIVGEPTSMQVAIAHKGKTAAICTCSGVEAHSALVDKGLNAIYLASDMIQGMRGIQQAVKLNSQHDHHYSVPYTTLHIGTITGGTALNIIPGECQFKLEIRNIHSDNPDEIIGQIQTLANDVLAGYGDQFPQAKIKIDVYNQYPALNTSPEQDVVKLVQGLMETDEFIKLAFGTEGGLFQSKLNVATVVCGPGSMDQGHKPDEFIYRSELKRCDAFLEKLLNKISQ